MVRLTEELEKEYQKGEKKMNSLEERNVQKWKQLKVEVSYRLKKEV